MNELMLIQASCGGYLVQRSGGTYTFSQVLFAGSLKKCLRFMADDMKKREPKPETPDVRKAV
jgi:hypothetical protein